MDVEDFIECSFEKLLLKKGNSFSRNLVAQSIEDVKQHQDLFRLRKEDNTNGQMVVFLFICTNLTIHALDEQQSPISFQRLSEIYGDAVFVLQWLEWKHAFVITLFRNSEGESDISKFFNQTYHSGSGNKILNGPDSKMNDFLDFGYLKCAMSMSKNYGIQDLLEIAWNLFLKANSTINSAQFVFNIDSLKLSTCTTFATDSISLFGRAKIINYNTDKLRYAIDNVKKYRL